MIRFLNKHQKLNWTIADQGVVSGVNFITGLLIARFLGIEAFGVFTLVWMAVLFVNSIQIAMISAPMMTIGPKQSDEERASYYGAVVMNQLIFSISTSILLWVGVTFSDSINPAWQVAHLALPLAVTLFFVQNQDFVRRLLFTENKPVSALISDIISYLGRVIILILLFIYSTLTISEILWIFASCSAVALVVGFAKIDTMVFNLKQIAFVFKRHWAVSKWMTASAVMQWTSGNYFILVAGVLLGPVAVGALKAAQNIIGITHILFQGLENIVPAEASRYFINNSIQGLKQYLLKVTIWGGSSTAIIALLVSLYPNELLGLVYGYQYEIYGNILQLYALTYVLMFFSLPLRSGLRVLEDTRPLLISFLLATIFSVFSANIFVSMLGLEGAVFGVLCAQLIITFTLHRYFLNAIKAPH
jgi:O-antigen/teichoic acid export membrane protein